MSSILESLDLNIPIEVNSEIPILLLASNAFIYEVTKLEKEIDLCARSAEAITFIKQNNLKESFSYADLDKMLRDPFNYSLEAWRNLYLIERSIPPRNPKYTWMQRIKIFNNTNLIESGIVEYGLAPNGNKFYWRKGSTEHPTNHDKLCIGKGQPLADFYFYDDSAGMNTIDKMVSTECKYSSFNTVEEGAIHFRKDHSYGVRYLMLYHAKDAHYYLVDYKDNIIIPQPQIRPTGKLLDIYQNIAGGYG